FKQLHQACDAVSKLYFAGLHPAALELIDKRSAQITVDYLERNSELEGLNKSLFMDNEAHLLIMFDGDSVDSVYSSAEKAAHALLPFDIAEIMVADTETNKERIW